jgi:hypothetical protein
VDGIQIQDALLDLMFVEDRAWRMTIGRGLGQPADRLRVLAFVEPRPAGEFAKLAQHVELHASALSACVLVLLRLDEDRLRLLRALAAAGVHLLALVMGPALAVSPSLATAVHAIDPSDVAASLARVAPVA